MQSARIFTFVIATLLLLMLSANANDSSGSNSKKVGATVAATKVTESAATAAPPKETTAAAAALATTATEASATTGAPATTTAPTTTAAPTTKVTPITTTASVTLASSNAPATLTNVAGTLLPPHAVAATDERHDESSAAAGLTTTQKPQKTRMNVATKTAAAERPPHKRIVTMGMLIKSAQGVGIEETAARMLTTTTTMATPTITTRISAPTTTMAAATTTMSAATTKMIATTKANQAAATSTPAALGSKSQATVAATEETTLQAQMSAALLQLDNGNEASTKIKNANINWDKNANANMPVEQVERPSPRRLIIMQPDVDTSTTAPSTNQNSNVEQNDATIGEAAETTSSTNEMTPIVVTTSSSKTDLTPDDNVFEERKLDNGLYRIKLAEIVTDEFNGQQAIAAAATSMAPADPTTQHPQQEQQKSTAKLLDITTTSDANIIVPQVQLQERTEGRNEQPDSNVQADKNENKSYNDKGSYDHGYGSASTSTATPGKVNIVDLYPMKIEDFNPIIRDSNAKLLKERTIFKPIDAVDVAEHRQNLLPNEVDDDTPAVSDADSDVPPPHSPATTVNRRIVTATSRTAAAAITTTTDFTGQVLAEQDGVITEIEQKFRLNEFGGATTGTNEITRTTAMPVPTTTKTASTKSSYSVNHHKLRQLPGVGYHGHDFIDRRVKKSFDFPMHRAASDAMLSVPHVDFANTKFNNAPSHSSGNSGGNSGATLSGNGSSAADKEPQHTLGTHPEFSTTKFYNSKELYNEMMQHSRQKQKVKAANKATPQASPYVSNHMSSSSTTSAAASTLSAASRFSLAPSAKLKTNETNSGDLYGSAQRRNQSTEGDSMNSKTNSGRWRTSSFTSTSPNATPGMRSKASKDDTSTMSSATTRTTATSRAASTTTTAPSVDATVNTRKYQNELKRAKLLLKTILVPSVGRNVAAAAKPTTLPATAPRAMVTSMPVVGTSAAAAATDKTFDVITTVKDFIKSPSSTVASVNIVGSVETETVVDTPTTITNISKPSVKERQAAMATSGAKKMTATASLRKSINTTITTSQTDSNADWQQLQQLERQQQQQQHQQVNNHHTTNPTKSTLKPIVRPRILSRLQEKINSLECEIQNVPQDSHLWRGNETHELLLPIMTAENCPNSGAPTVSGNGDGTDCASALISWEGEAEIQSGDILIVEINDALLNLNDHNDTNSAHNTQVYQVTRSGHEHCDVTEGILLDITPLVVDGRKLVTLYDKDLTEGVNLLIVVSELWGTQCVRLKVTTKTDNCGENADCSGKGVCYSNGAMEDYECQCCSGFAGPHCEEIDACTPSPCTNNGICVDLSQGHEGNSYQCLCPYGYTGKNCQYESDPCNSAECMNGGTCVGNSTHFRCDCTAGFTGPLCQHSLNECESSPCVHGICVDQEDGFRCFCQPGFAGELCNFEYNECESNPCQNDGECIDHIGSFECRCTKGYTGARCQIKVDFCANKPCPDGHRCIDHGNDFSCECPGGHNGLDCNQMPRMQCNVNPCTHGGTCWSSGNSFYCACRPGYTGTMCEDEFVVETVVSSSEFMVDDTSARNFNDKSFGSSVVLKSPIELHNAYFAAGVLAAAVFIVAVVVAICHCKVNQTYRKFSTRSATFFPILGFGRRHKTQNKLNKHWLSGKGLVGGVGGGGGGAATGMHGGSLRSNGSTTSLTRGHLPSAHQQHHQQQQQQQQQHQQQGGQLHERPFQRHLAMNLENDMYYTVDFSENSQHSPLIQ